MSLGSTVRHSRLLSSVRFGGSTRTFATSSSVGPNARLYHTRRYATAGLCSTAAAGIALYAYKSGSVIHADSADRDEPERVFKTTPPLSELVRTYVVYTLCSVPLLVDWSPTILSTLLAIPGLKQITETVVRVTFFDQFVGGDAAEDVIPVLEKLRAANQGALFVYSVEVDEATAAGSRTSTPSECAQAHKQIIEENLHCIDVAADFEERYAPGSAVKGTWVAIKLSAMVPDAESLRRLSKHLVDSRPRSSPYVAFPGCPLPSDLDILASGPNETVTEADIQALRELRNDLITVCERARQRGIRITVDAEHSWYQPAIDAFTLDLMRQFNKLPKPTRSFWAGLGLSKATQLPSGTLQPLVYNTFQGYLRRTPEYLAQSLAAARAEGYAIGVKLVRGAYHPHEIEIHRAAVALRASEPTSSLSGSHELSISPDNMPPVWLTKDETDYCYDSSVRLLVSSIREDVENSRRNGTPPSIGALFGTHNWDSANLVVDELVKQGLARGDSDGKVTVREEAMKRVAVAQLYGMSDALTTRIVERARSSSPFVLKYLPYGKLSEVMPYLSRRAIENKSVLENGGAAVERKRAAKAIYARLFGSGEV